MSYKNKEKQALASKKHYEANKELIINRAKINNILAIERNKKYKELFLLKNPCVDCGESDPVVLEFDHVNGIKKKNISDMVKDGYSLKLIQEEMNKCEIRCANCHRRITYQRRMTNISSTSTMA